MAMGTGVLVVNKKNEAIRLNKKKVGRVKSFNNKQFTPAPPSTVNSLTIKDKKKGGMM